MSAEQAEEGLTSQNGRPDSERSMSRERLDTPEMKARIAKAKQRASASEGGSGKTADDLLKLAHEQRRVDTRT